jgi:tetratricopeptide (TPR) repeat protein
VTSRTGRHVPQGKIQLPLLLLAVLAGAGLFYPALAGTLQRSQVEQLLAEDNLDAARARLDALLTRNPSDGYANYLKAVLLRRSGNTQDYPHWRDRAAEFGVSLPLLDLQDRFLAVQQGAISRSEEQSLLQQVEPWNSDALAAQTYEAIARGYLSTYRLQEAWQCLEYWVQWRSDAISARLMRGEILIRTGMPKRAVDEYRLVLARSPTLGAAQEKLATTLLNLNEVDEAAELLRSLSTQQPKASTPWIELAEAERRLGNLEASRQALDKALRLGVDPRGRGRCYSILGQLALAEQQPQQAVELLLAATELTPEDATAHHALGSALALSGQSELGALHRDRARLIRESYEQIQTWTRQVIEDPNNADLRWQIGKALIEQGLQSEGLEWVQTALQCDSNHLPARQLLEQLKPGHAAAS